VRVFMVIVVRYVSLCVCSWVKVGGVSVHECVPVGSCVCVCVFVCVVVGVCSLHTSIVCRNR